MVRPLPALALYRGIFGLPDAGTALAARIGRTQAVYLFGIPPMAPDLAGLHAALYRRPDPTMPLGDRPSVAVGPRGTGSEDTRSPLSILGVAGVPRSPVDRPCLSVCLVVAVGLGPVVSAVKGVRQIGRLPCVEFPDRQAGLSLFPPRRPS